MDLWSWDWKSLLWKLGAGAGGLYALMLLVLVAFQERMMYVPAMAGLPKEYAGSPEDWDMGYEDVWLTSGDGVKLHSWVMWPTGWDLEQRRRQPTLVFFQENAGNMSYRLHFLAAATRALHCNAFILGYRGYGRSRGTPSEAGLKMDATAALTWLAAGGGGNVDPEQLVIMGRSLGGGLAIWAAGEALAGRIPGAPRGVILENTFCSTAELAPRLLPLLRPLLGKVGIFNWVLRSPWRNADLMSGLVDRPVLLLSSLKDEMLDPRDMRRLYSVHPSRPWRLVTFPEGTHMDAYMVAKAAYWREMRDFMEELFLEEGEGAAAPSAAPDAPAGEGDDAKEAALRRRAAQAVAE